MSLRVAGLGLALPQHALSQEDAAELLLSFLHPDGGRPRSVKALYARSGIRQRYSVLLDRGEGPLDSRQAFYPPAADEADEGPATAERMAAFEEHAPKLVGTAAERALADAGVDAKSISHLVTVSCTGFFSPGLDAALIHRLGLSPAVERTHVGFMGCHGALNGLRVASSFVNADPRAKVLLCSVELSTLHLGYSWDPQTVVANALFADGAAAMVGVGDTLGSEQEAAARSGLDPAGGSADGRAVGSANGATGDRPTWTVAATGTLLLPDSADAMSWRVGDHGFRMTLSASVPDLIRRHVGGWLQEWLGQQGLDLDDVRSWAVHPGGPRVLTAFGDAVDLPNEAFTASRKVLGAHGNMSSATLLFILDELRATGAEAPLVALAFGPGLVAEVALLV
jgi:predicted naringenin-chalcone synthase